MDKAFAEQFAADWIDSWNSHDLDRVLSHYDDFEMSSPVIRQLVGEASGMLRGKTAEVFHFGAEHTVTNAFAHYDLSTAP
jgi:ketosteroid isomerase-like protein